VNVMRKENEECDQINSCGEEIVHQFLEVEAQVTITPLVRHGRPKVTCLGSELKKDDCNWGTSCRSCRKDECTYTLRQVLCVEIPITLGVDVDVDEGITHCGRPEFGPCNKPHHKSPKDTTC